MRHSLSTCLLATMLIVTVFPVAMTDNGAAATEIITFDTDIDFLSGTFNGTKEYGTGGSTYLSIDDGGWLYPGMTYRHGLNISQAVNGHLSDFQVRIFLDTQSLIGGGWMNANCSDLRFSYLGELPVPYWIKGPINDTATEIWLRVPSLAANSTTAGYHMYYGNANAAPMSDHDSVFGWETQIAHSGPVSGKAVDLAVGPNNLPQMVHFGASGNYGVTYTGMRNYSTQWITDQIKWDTDYNGFTDSNRIAVDSTNRPHVAYSSDWGGWLNYTVKTGFAWSAEDNIGLKIGGIAQTHDISLDSLGIPHASFCGGSWDLAYGNKTGGSWATTPLDVVGDVGTYNSIALDDNDWPHFAYYDTSNTALKYANYSGIGWSFIGLDLVGDVGKYPQIQLDADNMAHIMYYNDTANSVKYAFQQGSGWNISTVVDGVFQANSFSFALDPLDKPALAWSNGSSLNYTTWTGSGWQTTVIDSGGLTVGDYCSLTFDSYGMPIIGYRVSGPFDASDDSILKLASMRKYISPEPTAELGPRETNTVRTWGRYTTPSIYAGSGPDDVLALVWSATVSPETTLGFRVASNDDNATWNYLGPDGTNNTYYDTSGQGLWDGHFGDDYFRIMAFFNVTNTSRPAPKLDWLRLDINRQPDMPSSPLPSGGSWTPDSTPLFTWAFTDPDIEDSQAAFHLQIDDDSSFSSVNYDSGQQSSVSGFWDFPSGTALASIPDGQWFWRVRVQDSNGFWSNYTAPILLEVDATPPTTTASINGNHFSDDGYAYLRASGTISLAASDGEGSGINATWYKLGDSGAWTQYVDGIILDGLLGNIQLYFNSTDDAGNSEAPNVLSLMVDNATGPSSGFGILGPHLDDTAASGQHYVLSSDSVVVLSLADQIYKDMASIKYRIDDGEWLDYSGGFQITAPGYEHTLEFHAVDMAGNEESTNFVQLMVDDEAPVTTLYSMSNYSLLGDVMHINPDTLLELDVLDLPLTMPMPGMPAVSGAGANVTWYNVDDGPWTPYVEGFTPESLGLDSGPHKIGYLSVDNIGNIEIARHTNIYVDTDIPFALIGDDMIVRAGRSVHFSGADSVDDGTIVNWTWEITADDGDGNSTIHAYSSDFDMVFDDAGTYNVKLTITDAVGNSDDARVSLTVLAVTDMDLDGLPDAWENEFFGNLGQTPVDDPDSDGLDNSEEYVLGTDPTVAEKGIAGRYFLQPPLPWWAGWLLMVVVAAVMALLYTKKTGPEIVTEKEATIIPPAPFDHQLFEVYPEMPAGVESTGDDEV